MYLGIRIFPLPKCQQASLRTNERVEVRATSCPKDGELFLKAVESKFRQRNGYVVRKRENYPIIIVHEGT